MTETGKKFFGTLFGLGVLIIIALHLIGCVDVGGSTSGVDATTTSTSDQEQTQEPAE